MFDQGTPAMPPHIPSPPDLLAALNETQRDAVTHTHGPVLIVAGAGTGKTTTLAHRVAWLIDQGVPPERILLLTFTRRAASEMMRRVDGLLEGRGSVTGGRAFGGTFHSAASRLLRLHARDLSIEPDFTILDRADSEDLMNLCRTELGLGRGSSRFPQKSTCLDIYSRCVNAQAPLTEVLPTAFPWCRHAESGLSELFGAYTDVKEEQHVLDYDDLLLFWHALLADPVAGDRIRERFDHVLVDEYQDTNALQADIVSLLRPDGSGVTCVGDDAQAIYGFRAATVRNILDFEERFAGASVVTLTRNYRSSAPILDATNAIIAEATERRDKQLWTERTDGGRPEIVACVDEAEQTTWLADRILEHREQGMRLQSQAVLFRAQHHSMALEMELSRRHVPFRKYGGLRFVEMAHIKDLAAFLRLAENPRDSMAALRVLGLIPGIGPKIAARLHDRLVESGCDFEAWVGMEVPEQSRETWRTVVSLMRSLTGTTADIPSQIQAVRSVYAPLIELRYDNAAARMADLEQIEALSGGVSSRTELLTEMAIDAPSWTSDVAGPPLLDEDYLILSTIHSAKGLEFDAVYVIHAADGNIPSDMATGRPEEIEEERRLFYVACTRARHNLYVTHPMRYYKAGNPMTDVHGYAQRTRFLTDAVVPHFIQTTARPPHDEQSQPDTLPRAATARVRDNLRALW